ncbi:S8 family serine peptidase [Rhodanobacter sp. DHG33]|uniref:S8 family serine peptidase n=1 Tax=Rhodanobacter sp. DHG33 TaxID=2775921 RepID=UPI0017822587|nr:S8 family serine peptidase [Rhodanobacter sp. DHG33]MBD8900336.1 S8 family serine peptidase [Rhodanobacter sp. DHG33]
MPLRRASVLSVTVLAAVLAWGGRPSSAQAQVLGPVQRGLPPLPLPTAPLPSAVPGVNLQGVDDLLRQPLALSLKTQVDALLRAEPRRVTVDPSGAPILRGEFLAVGLSDAQRDALQAQGFTVDPEDAADATLGLDFMVLHDTRGRSTRKAMRTLQQAAPDATFTYQHLYLPAGDAYATSAAGMPDSVPAMSSRSVGMVDGGVDPADPALTHAHVQRHGCSTVTASRHGTAVAARLVAGDPDTLYAADLWCGDDVGGATSRLVDALAWMDRERVAVINISLVGPDNPVLARAVQAMIARGHVLVGAAGNDGPAAPPLYPASYPGVIGVGAVDARGRVLPESASGKQVAFCASGVVGSGPGMLRGTSFAAPIAARKAAQALDTPYPGAAAQALQQLIGEAHALDTKADDARCGHGLLSP